MLGFLKQLVFQNKPTVRELLDQFFSGRWEVIKETNTHYLNDLLNPANIVCVELVKRAGFYKETPFLSILIPPLASVPLVQYVSSPYDDRSLGLQELILSDCGSRLINCREALAFACQDARLKHNSLGPDSAVLLLTDGERNRLLSRHPSFRRAYDAVTEEFSYKNGRKMDAVTEERPHQNFSQSVGVRLQFLVDELKGATPSAGKGGRKRTQAILQTWL